MQDEKRSLLRVRPDPLAYLICTSDGKDKAMIQDQLNQAQGASAKMEVLQSLVIDVH